MKYTAIFLFLGGLVSYLAVTVGGWGQILHWFSVSCLLLSAGYAGLGSYVFGKGHDGRIPAWSKIVHLPFMLYSSLVWHLVRIFSRENPTDEVSEDLILGRRLCASELPSGIANYVDLTAETEDPKAIRERESYVAFPILDADVPAPLALRRAVAGLRPGKTFVHCAQGHGRTGLFALALLAERGQISSYDEGIAKLTSVRPRLTLNAKQQAFMRKYIGEQPPAPYSEPAARPLRG